MKIKIYKMLFSDGAEYVGRTQIDLEYRLARHFHKPTNIEVYKRLKRGTKFKMWILAEVDEADADSVEKAEIEKLNHSLNWTHRRGETNGRLKPRKLKNVKHFGCKDKVNRYPYPQRRERDYRCFICRQYRPGSEFYACASRYNGLASKCKWCHSLTVRAMRKSVKEGGTSSQGYYKMKRQIREQYS